MIIDYSKYTNPIDRFEYPNCYQGFQYALDVLNGKIPNCVFIINCCDRFLRDYEKAKEESCYWFLDIPRSEKFLKKIQLFNHVKGEWDTENIKYLPWQKFFILSAFGYRHKENPKNPKYRVIHAEWPRGQGKSAIASQIVLYFLALDDPKGNEISCFATKSDQARIVLDSSRAMAKQSKKYLDSTGVNVLAHKITHDSSNSFVRAMSSDDKSLDGLNDILSVCDELHAMSRELFEVVSSGMSKRRDSVLLCITTAGFSTDSIGYYQSNYAKKVATGEVEDEQFYSMVYTVDDGDDIFEESTWRKANPNYGHSVDPITFEAKAKKAQITPSDIPNFKVKHLNIWISESRAYYDSHSWEKGFDPELTFDFFKNKKCHIGLDLASKVDLASQVAIHREKDIYYIWDNTYIPENRLNEIRSTLYDEAVAKGFLLKTPGEAIDIATIEKNLLDWNSKMNILSCLYDPWNCIGTAQRLEQKNMNMVEFKMNTGNLTEATKTLDALIRQNKIRHNGSPLMKWCIGNVVCKEDANGNVFPRKSNEKLKIDPVIALLMALAAWLQEKDDTSIYEERGIRVL